MKVLVTGATGFLGYHLITRLLADGDRVRALVRPETNASELAILGVELVRGDVRDRDVVRVAVAGCELVYHLAKAHSSSSKRTVQEVNVGGTANLARAVLQVDDVRVVHASSASVYGSVPTNLPVHEDSPMMPDSEYAESKAQAERILQAEHRQAGLPVVLARITSVLGPRTMGWGPLFNAIARRRLWLPGKGEGHRHLVDVADVIDGLIRCGRTPGIEGRTYNLAGQEAIKLRELADLIARELEVGADYRRMLPAAPFRVYKRASDTLARLTGVQLPRAEGISNLISDRFLDISRASRELGYTPSIGMPEAIRRMAQWYRLQGYLPKTALKNSSAAQRALL